MKKGFTLIELLAVTIVLSIVSIISVPMMLNIMETARKNAAKVSCYHYMEAVENYVAKKEMKRRSDFLYNEKYYLTKDTLKENFVYPMMNEIVDLKGTFPIGLEDYVIVNKDGVVIKAEFIMDGYHFVFDHRKIIGIEKVHKIEIEKMNLNYTKEIMEKGSTLSLKPIFTPIQVTNPRVKYESEKEDIAQVDSSGNILALKEGKTNIIVTSLDNDQIYAKCEIIVISTIPEFKIEPSEVTIKIGTHYLLKGIFKTGTTQALKWSSSDSRIASVNQNGVIRAKKEGKVTITAETKDDKKATSQVTIRNYFCKQGALAIIQNEFICLVKSQNQRTCPTDFKKYHIKKEVFCYQKAK